MSAATGVLVELIFHKCKMSSCINQVNAIYPISKFETNFVTSVQLKIFPLIHSKSGTIPTSRQNVQNLGILNKKESKGALSQAVIVRYLLLDGPRA